MSVRPPWARLWLPLHTSPPVPAWVFRSLVRRPRLGVRGGGVEKGWVRWPVAGRRGFLFENWQVRRWCSDGRGKRDIYILAIPSSMSPSDLTSASTSTSTWAFACSLSFWGSSSFAVSLSSVVASATLTGTLACSFTVSATISSASSVATSMVADASPLAVMLSCASGSSTSSYFSSATSSIGRFRGLLARESLPCPLNAPKTRPRMEPVVDGLVDGGSGAAAGTMTSIGAMGATGAEWISPNMGSWEAARRGEVAGIKGRLKGGGGVAARWSDLNRFEARADCVTPGTGAAAAAGGPEDDGEAGSGASMKWRAPFLMVTCFFLVAGAAGVEARLAVRVGELLNLAMKLISKSRPDCLCCVWAVGSVDSGGRFT
ncbi:hypothetical protein SODALDRAFT_59102 [Sodiomyces alkalinus F11]|uniref:Uncharacterized protein n=1 Tax=Sodiomyces alkalinus (strain CBS 110278 / VKM F-3762 / F11) TaxID=1314773 RepID=A0A3N2PNU4_SODAK|nr:hypothetical protein SODALDRAFT_59102 [Sodiomyces alkalinus F11]ROT36169.1 hypothetical protein SODALDRAFT_59102 [Sodiomyces alkalinus F11]